MRNWLQNKLNVGKWRERAIPESLTRWEKWDRQMRRQYGLLRTLRWFTKNNTGGFQIVSLRWPHRLCWTWTMGWHPYQKWRHGRRRVMCLVRPQYHFVELHVWFGYIRLCWQDYGYMNGLSFKDAPKIVWAHNGLTAYSPVWGVA